MFVIKEELIKLPNKPGVYLMKDSSDEIIYVGKAVVLKNRVKSYFQNFKSHSPKTKVLVSKIESFEYIVTNSELEALILECTLIKRYRPKFNILLKDDKQYPFIKVTVNETYPRIMMVRKNNKDGAKYFGPYSSGFAVRETISLIKRIFPIKTCNRQLPRDIGKERPCLNYHIGQCLGLCNGEDQENTLKEYRKMIDQVCAVIDGKYEEVSEGLNRKMNEAAAVLDFERAASYRDKLNSLEIATQKQKVVSNKMDEMDVFAYAGDLTDICMQVFMVRNGRVCGRENFMLERLGQNGAESNELLTGFLKQYYSVAAYVPKEVVIPNETDETVILEEWLTAKREEQGEKSKTVSIITPQRGLRKQLLDMATENAKISLIRFNENKLKEEEMTKESLTKLKEILELKELPIKIEAYDISNNGDTEMVASKIVFSEGKPYRKGYRKYKIKTVEGINDYACMQEVIHRRIARIAEDPLPNLILVDGGLGHVHAVQEVLNEKKVSVALAGMVKDDKHRSRGLIRMDGKEVILSDNINMLRFITAMQDEGHRVAIEYGRKLTSKRYKTSVLDNIEGIGEARRKSILKYFGGINKVKTATVEELKMVKGISEANANAVAAYFKKYT